MPLVDGEVAPRTRSNVLEYMQIFGKTTDKTPPDRWRPLVESEYKINVDGSFVPGQLHVGWGIAVRTAEGNLVCASAGRQENISDAFAAEVVAMSHVINIAAHFGLVRVEFETDS